MDKRSGTKFIFAEPEGDDRTVVSMLEFQGRVLVATKKGIYRLEGEKMIRLEFVDNTPLRVPDDISSPVPLQAPESPVRTG